MRLPRKAAALVIATATALSVASCDNGSPTAVAKNPAKTTSTATSTVRPTPTTTNGETFNPTADNPLGVDWAKQTPFTGPASVKFGASNVMAAYREAVTFSVVEGYTNLMAKGLEARPVEFSMVKPYMTQDAQARWDANVKAALAGDFKQQKVLSSLTNWNLTAGQKVYTFRPGQIGFTDGMAWTAATTSVETIEGTDYLVMKFSMTRQVRLMKAGKAVLVPVKKDYVYWMTPNGLKETPWLFSYWTTTSNGPGQPTPDPLGATD